MRPDLRPSLAARSLEDRFREFIQDRDFPCVGAKSALAHNTLRIVVARDLGAAWDDLRIYAAIREFAVAYRAKPGPFQSLAVIFENHGLMREDAFEAALWSRLQSLHEMDSVVGEAWDPRVSSDPADPHFSLSLAGEAFFVLGLHPGASRAARRFEAPVLVFNPHDQFEVLRTQGRYEILRERIIGRDMAVNGSANPMLTRFGEASEAPQYSGRAVGSDWKCPFHRKALDD